MKNNGFILAGKELLGKTSPRSDISGVTTGRKSAVVRVRTEALRDEGVGRGGKVPRG